MTVDSQSLYWILGGGAFVFFALVLSAFAEDGAGDLERRLARVGPQGSMRKIGTGERQQHAVRQTHDSGIAFLNTIIRLLPHPDKLRARLARTGTTIRLGDYLLVNALLVLVFYVIFHGFLSWIKIISVPLAMAIGLGLPHMVTGYMGGKRIKKFLAEFPEAIDTVCRGLRSGLPVTESIASVGREMPDPVGLEFHRIADGVHMGKSLEASMWEITRRIDVPEYRFLIIAMAIQKETGGNLAETLGNLAELIRKRRQLRLKIKAMSSEARASAMIIGSLPFIMFGLLSAVSPEYLQPLFHTTGGKIILGAGIFWMALGWGVMTKMIHFEI